jgi:hypothetical protein
MLAAALAASGSLRPLQPEQEAGSLVPLQPEPENWLRARGEPCAAALHRYEEDAFEKTWIGGPGRR